MRTGPEGREGAAEQAEPVTDASEFFVRFWGVRGSIPTSDPGTLRYGGNTSCLEVRCGGRLLMFDAGTGCRYLGNELMKQGPIDADVFLTHTHFDHIGGIPFFRPFFAPGNRFRLWAGHLKPQRLSLQAVLKQLMKAPLFPVPPSVFRADIEFRDFSAGDTLTPLEGVTLRTCRLNHPNLATGYRIEYAGKSVCYLTDTEHKPGGPDPNILGLIGGADLVIYDAMFTPEEHEQRRGWGHSTWEEGVRLCDLAGAKTLVLFHHDPDHDDDFMDRIAADVEAARPGSIVAREGLVLKP